MIGYSAALPQILKQCEIDTFITTKLGWNDQNQLPYDTFYWRGLDGTSVLTHFIKGDGACSGGTATPRQIASVWESYYNKDLNTSLLTCMGYGDGGGGPNRDMLESARRVGRVPGMPGVKVGRVDQFCQQLHKTVEENPRDGYVPVWDGELYLEFHRGTYNSQAYNKKANRRMEFLLRSAEAAVAAAACRGRDMEQPRRQLEESWKIVLCQQFHVGYYMRTFYTI